MKKKLLYILLLIGICSNAFSQNVLPKPNPPRLVVDNANVLSPQQRQILEEQLVALDDSTSNQICIVTIPTLGDDAIEDYAVKLFRSWGIGNKKTNNGILILVAADDHKMRIEVGYGLEGTIPDVTAASIMDNDMKPSFKEGNYYEGLEKAINSLGLAAAGEYKVARDKKRGRDSGGGGGTLLFIVIVIIIIIVLRGGGGGNGRRRGGGSLLPFLFLNSGGGNWGGRSSGWGGGGGGGGFGGFGGGSSGGGGASGSW